MSPVLWGVAYTLTAEVALAYGAVVAWSYQESAGRTSLRPESSRRTRAKWAVLWPVTAAATLLGWNRAR